MPLLDLKTLLDHAAECDYGVPAFNFCNMEQLLSVLEAASLTDSPVIIQVSSGGRKYASNTMLRSLVEAAVARYPKLPIVWHQDHAHTIEECFESIRAGYTSVMMDGSLDVAGQVTSLEENIERTRAVVEVAHTVGVSVEGEIGCLGRLEGAHEDATPYLTQVSDAVRFMRETEVDALAVAIGTSHGAYKFSTRPTDSVLALSRLAQLHEALPEVHFVLHGSSSVPEHYLNIIRNCGGEIPETYGVPIESMQQAIRLGVRKFNIDTDLRIVSIAVMRQSLSTLKSCLDPRKIQKKVMQAVSSIVAERYEALGTAGKASLLMKRCS